MYVCVAREHAWKVEDSLRELVLFRHHMGPRRPGLAARVLTHRAISSPVAQTDLELTV